MPYNNFSNQTHLLIAGATGSGKSVVIGGIIDAILKKPNADHHRITLIDPKRVELRPYIHLPTVDGYASEPKDIEQRLYSLTVGMDKIYRKLAKQGKREATAGYRYIIIDEYADLVTTCDKSVQTYIQRIAQLGRAAHFKLIIATQRPTRDIINGAIKVNIDSRLALRCPTAQDSRNIVNVSGAELLPRYGKGIYTDPLNRPHLINIPYVMPEVTPLTKRELKRKIKTCPIYL